MDGKRLYQRLGVDRSLSGFERDRLFARLAPGQPLVDVGAISGIDLIGDGRSAVSADFDGDGDLDILVRQIQAPKLSLLRNDGPNGKSAEVRVQGRAMGLNATVTAKIGARTFVRQFLAGAGYCAQDPMAVHIGLGAAQTIDSLEVKFLSGKVARAEKIAAGSIATADEETGAIEVKARPPARALGANVPRDDQRPLATAAAMLEAVTEETAKAVQERREKAGLGRPMLINLWAPWCKPCANELPALSAWAAAHPEVDVLALSVDGTDAAVAESAKKLGLTAPSGAFATGAPMRLGIGGSLPATWYYGADGKLVRAWFGAIDFASFTAPAPVQPSAPPEAPSPR